MASIAELRAQIVSGSDSPADLERLSDMLNSLHDLIKRPENANALLGQLDPAKHSLAYLIILDAQLSSPAAAYDAEGIIQRIVGFINACSPGQIQLAPEKFHAICRSLTTLLSSRSQFMRAIPALRSAIGKIQPSPAHLTPQHPMLLQMCLQARCYSLALPALLQHDGNEAVIAIDPKAIDVSSNTFLHYCYYGAMVHIGLKQFKDALQLLSHALCSSSSVSSLHPVSLASFKKYVLVSLIQHGQVLPFPKHAPAHQQRTLKAMCEPYTELATTYALLKTMELQQIIEKHKKTLTQDSNLGLAKQVLSSIPTRCIQRLTQTYLTLSLQDIAKAAGLPTARQAELQLLSMVSRGEIHASINQPQGMVSFREDPERYDSWATAARLDQQIKRCMNLARKVSTMEEEISSSRTYLSKVQMKQHGRFGETEDFEPGSRTVYDGM